jgi:hypothetical protein
MKACRTVGHLKIEWISSVAAETVTVSIIKGSGNPWRWRQVGVSEAFAIHSTLTHMLLLEISLYSETSP